MKTALLALAVLALSNLNGLRAWEVCCDDLGCFNDAKPYDFLPLPRCPEYLGFSIKLYTRGNKLDGEEFTRTKFPPSFNASWGLMFIVHGYIESELAEWMHATKDAMLEKEDYNVVIVGWKGGAQTIFVLQAVMDTRSVGAEIALLAQKAIDKGLPRTSLYCVGHSLGGQVCGFAGNRLKFGRITGLDPAAPVFEDRGIGLSSSSAGFVDVIHTYTKLNLGLVRVGVAKAIGHVDFYPNGGQTQAGCDGSAISIDMGDIVDSPSLSDLLIKALNLVDPACSHLRAVFLFIESILTPCFESRSSCSDEFDLPGSCKNEGKVQNMGLNARSYASRGIFYLTTKKSFPFCEV